MIVLELTFRDLNFAFRLLIVSVTVAFSLPTGVTYTVSDALIFS